MNCTREVVRVCSHANASDIRGYNAKHSLNHSSRPERQSVSRLQWMARLNNQLIPLSFDGDTHSSSHWSLLVDEGANPPEWDLTEKYLD